MIDPEYWHMILGNLMAFILTICIFILVLKIIIIGLRMRNG